MGLTKVFVFQTSLCIVWIHNDSISDLMIYIRFGGIRNTKTWSKSGHITLSLQDSLKMSKVEVGVLCPVQEPRSLWDMGRIHERF